MNIQNFLHYQKGVQIMKINSLPRLLALPLALLLVAIVILVPHAKPVGANPDQVVDHFTFAQLVSQNGAGSSWSAVSDASIVGNEREITVTVAAGTTTTNAESNAPAHKFSVGAGSDDLFIVTLTYDGNDNNPNLNPSGLALNLSADNAFVVQLDGNDFATDITLTIYSGSVTTCSSRTIRTSGGLNYGQTPRALIFRFSDFTLGAGCSSTANFASVGAVQIVFNTQSTGNFQTDITIDLFQSAVIDYGDLPTAYNAISRYSSNGAAHMVNTSGIRLGSLIDGENDRIAHANAAGDDLNNSDDEDGVIATPGVVWTTGVGGGSVRVTVAGGDSCLFGWIDWDDSGDFDGVNENIILQQAVTTGTADYTFTIPGTVSFPNTFLSRFRVIPRRPSTGACAEFDATTAQSGMFVAGEVEDHRIGGAAPSAVNLSSMTATTESNSLTLFGVAGLLGIAIVSVVVMMRRRT